MKILFLLCLCGFYGQSLSIDIMEVPFEVDLKRHLSSFQDYRYPTPTFKDHWIQARSHIKEKLDEYGLDVKTQIFNSTVALTNNSLKKVEGENIIGVSYSEEKEASVLLIGADYDTPLHGNPLRQNGVGVAALMETARILQLLKDLEDLEQNTTIVYVAFDINTKIHVPSTLDPPGSEIFVKEWLPSFLGKKKFLGAIIFNSISEYNLEPNSQIFNENLSSVFPTAYQDIKDNDFAGDFLALVTKEDEPSSKLANVFSKLFNKEALKSRVRIQTLPLSGKNVSFNTGLFDVISKPSQNSFWDSNRSLPAILLTDMGDTREPVDDICHTPCSVEEFWTERRAQYLEFVTKATVRTLIQLQSPGDYGYDFPDEGPSSTSSSWNKERGLFLILCASLSVLFQLFL